MSYDDIDREEALRSRDVDLALSKHYSERSSDEQRLIDEYYERREWDRAYGSED